MHVMVYCTCINRHTHTYTHTHIYIYMYIYIYNMYISTYPHTCIHTDIQAYTWRMFIKTYIYIYIYSGYTNKKPCKARAMKPSCCTGLYFWRALTCLLALLLLLLQFTTLSLLTASTSVLLISHAGSHGKGFCKALKVTVARRCRRWVGCPEVLCEVDHGETIHHKRKGATPSRTFVLLLRDPRDVVTALHKKGHQSCSSRFDCSVQRIRSVANWTEAQHREYSNQPEAFILFFEEAASDPHETLHSLAGLLGMDLSSATDEEIGAWRNATKHGRFVKRDRHTRRGLVAMSAR